MNEKELLKKKKKLEEEIHKIDAQLKEIQNNKKTENNDIFDGHFSNASFPELPKGSEYDIVETSISQKYRKRIYTKKRSIGIKVGTDFRYEIFCIKMTDDNIFPVLLNEQSEWNESAYKNLKTLQRRIDEAVASDQVKDVIDYLEDVLKTKNLNKLKEGYLEIDKIEEMSDVRRLSVVGMLMHEGKKRRVYMQISNNFGKWSYCIYDYKNHSYIKAPFGLGSYTHDEFVWNQIWNNETFQTALENCSFKKELLNEGSRFFRPGAFEN